MARPRVVLCHRYYLLWIAVENFALARTVRARGGATRFMVAGSGFFCAMYADDAALFAESRAELLKSAQAVAIALALRLSA